MKMMMSSKCCADRTRNRNIAGKVLPGSLVSLEQSAEWCSSGRKSVVIVYEYQSVCSYLASSLKELRTTSTTRVHEVT